MTNRKRKRIIILGATGSIGDSTFRVIGANPDAFEVVGISAHNNHAKLTQLAAHYKVKAIAITGDNTHIPNNLPAGCTYYVGADAALKLLDYDADIVIAAMMGAAGIMPVMKAITLGRTIALANKEALVCAGKFMMDACKTHGAQLLPVDSEHNAIFQVLQGNQYSAVHHITLTASGGPFLSLPIEQLPHVTPAQAVAHPKWSMGAKISVDSATMMNKGLELIEARWLFDMAQSRIEVVIHPEAIIHGLVQYHDGSAIAQMSDPDMAIPISYCLHFPQRGKLSARYLDLVQYAALTFHAVEETRFPALTLARHVLDGSAASAIAFNAANEVAVDAFLRGVIRFTDIVPHVSHAVEKFSAHAVHCLEDVLALDTQVRLNSVNTLLKAA